MDDYLKLAREARCHFERISFGVHIIDVPALCDAIEAQAASLQDAAEEIERLNADLHYARNKRDGAPGYADTLRARSDAQLAEIDKAWDVNKRLAATVDAQAAEIERLRAPSVCLIPDQ